MNERLKELVEEAGIEWEINTAWVLPDGWWKAESADLERFAKLVRQDERKACAKLCEELVQHELAVAKAKSEQGARNEHVC